MALARIGGWRSSSTLQTSPCEDVIEMPLIPLESCHTAPGAGHQGVEKSLAQLRQEAFWANMQKDVEMFCKNCVICQRSKLPSPTPPLLCSMPIGRTWQMICGRHFGVPVSTNGNRYLMTTLLSGPSYSTEESDSFTHY